MPNAPVIHIEIPVRSIAAARPWYEGVLDWKIGKPTKDELGPIAMSFAGIAAVQIWQMRLPFSSGFRSALKSVWMMKWYCFLVTG